MMKTKWLVREPAFYKTLLMLAIPMALQGFLSVSVGLADSIMVGQINERAMAGVMVANQVQNILTFMVIGISAAMVIIAAQYWGKNDTDSIKALIAIGLKIALGISLVVSLVVLLFPAQVLRIFTNDVGAIEDGVRYIRILGFSYVFFCLTQVLMGSMRCVEVVKIGIAVSLSTLIISVTGN